MPRRAPTACGNPGCPHTRPCPDHPANRWADGAPGRPMPPGWPATRARILRRDPTCRLCWAAPATEVHHTQPGAEDDAHLIGACHPCHHRVSQQQATAARLAAAP